MDREKYLKLKYCPETPFCKVARVGVVVMAGLVLAGLVYNLGILAWSVLTLIN